MKIISIIALILLSILIPTRLNATTFQEIVLYLGNTIKCNDGELLQAKVKVTVVTEAIPDSAPVLEGKFHKGIKDGKNSIILFLEHIGIGISEKENAYHYYKNDSGNMQDDKYSLDDKPEYKKALVNPMSQILGTGFISKTTDNKTVFTPPNKDNPIKSITMVDSDNKKEFTVVIEYPKEKTSATIIFYDIIKVEDK